MLRKDCDAFSVFDPFCHDKTSHFRTCVIINVLIIFGIKLDY